MSKRKRVSLDKTPSDPAQPAPPIDPADESAAGADMVHVKADMLAGSPDIFAPASRAADAPQDPAPAAPEAAFQPVGREPEQRGIEPVSSADPARQPAPVSVTEPPGASRPPAAPFGPPPPSAFATPGGRPPRPRRGGSSIALGVVLVVLGIFALAIVLFGVDLTQAGWPLFVIIPGLTLLVVGFVGLGPGASVPGGIITMLGLVLAYQSSTNDWASWAFAWALVAPFGVGLGLYLQALRDRDQPALRRGRLLMGVGALIFMIGFVLFESILGVSGKEYGVFGKAALPLLLIVIGLILLVRSLQQRRQA
ncbi:MAG TPA: hypothetical protein VGG31_00600 [Candidatus Dormibacteraeota bacterium]